MMSCALPFSSLADDLMQLRSSMAACFTAAQDAGFTTLVLNPRVDDANEVIWRNYFAFDPMITYGKWNYRDAMIKPVAKALHESIRNGTTV